MDFVRSKEKDEMKRILIGLAGCMIIISVCLGVIGCTYSRRHDKKQPETGTNREPAPEKEQTDVPETGEMDILHQEAPLKELDIGIKENREDEMVFSFSIDDFIDSYNGLYWKDRGIRYLRPSWEWNAYLYDSAVHSRHKTCCYNFANDGQIQSFPTISVYVPANDDYVQEITVNFDDHSYTDQLYRVYEGMCFYTLKVLFPDLADEKLTELYTTLNQAAYDNMTTKRYTYGSVPAMLYYRGDVGVYPYFAIGEWMRICIVPVTGQYIEECRSKGVTVCEIK